MSSTTSRRSNHRRRSQSTYERLEPKKMLAGDVTAFALDGQLYIRGDAENNQVEIVASEHGQMWVKGIGDTTVNGHDFRLLLHTVPVFNDSHATSVFDGGLKVHMGPGHDFIRVVGAQFEDLSVIYGGTGNDRVEIEKSNFTDRITVQTFDGDDNIMSKQSDFQQELFVFGLEGADKVMLEQTNAHSDAIIVTGNGNDKVMVDSGNYLGGTQMVLAGNGDDTVDILNPNVSVDGFGVYAGNGSDNLKTTMHSGNVDGSVIVNGQSGTGDTLKMDVTDEMMAKMVSIGFEDESEILFDNGVVGATNVDYAITSYFDTANDNHRIANDIVFESETKARRIDWTGAYALDMVEGNQDPYDVDDFMIEIYEGTEDLPIGDPVASFDVGNNVNRIAYDPFMQEHMPEWTTYQYSAEIDMTFEADKVYWVSIYSKVKDIGPANGHGTWGNHFRWGVDSLYGYSGPNSTDVSVYTYGDNVTTNLGWSVIEGAIFDFQFRT